MRFTFNKSLLVASVLLAISSQSAFATNGMAPIGLGITQKAMGGAAVATSENTMNAIKCGRLSIQIINSQPSLNQSM